MSQCCINTIIINIAHGRYQHVYYDIVTTNATRSGINMLEERSRQIRNAHIRIDFLNKIVWLTIPLVLNYNNQQQVCIYDSNYTEHSCRITLSRPQVDACVLAFLRNRGNWNTQAHTGRIVVDYAAHSKNIRVSEQLGTTGPRL